MSDLPVVSFLWEGGKGRIASALNCAVAPFNPCHVGNAWPALKADGRRELGVVIRIDDREAALGPSMLETVHAVGEALLARGSDALGRVCLGLKPITAP